MSTVPEVSFERPSLQSTHCIGAWLLSPVAYPLQMVSLIYVFCDSTPTFFQGAAILKKKKKEIFPKVVDEGTAADKELWCREL